MAISSYPAPGTGEYSKVIYVGPSTSTSKVTFSGLRKGIYKPIGVASYTTETSTDGVKLLNVAYDAPETAGFEYAYLVNSSGQQLSKPGFASFDYNYNATGYLAAQHNPANLFTPADNSSIVLSMTTYRPVVNLHYGAMMSISLYSQGAPDLIIGNTMLTYTRNRSRAAQSESTGVFANIWYFGTNTTTFTTSIPAPTSVNLVSTGGFTHGYVCQVAYGSGETNKWVAVGAYAGDTSWGDSRPMIFSSTDAVTWTSRTTPGTWYNNANNYYAGLHNVIYSGGSYYASGIVCTTTTPSLAFASRIYTSTDGATWSQLYTRASSSSSVQFYDLCSAPSATEKFAMYDQNDGYLYTSTDAITWTSRPSIVINSYQHLSAANNKYFIFYQNGNIEYALSTSTDGITWTNCTLKYAAGTTYGPMNYDAGYYWASEDEGIVISTDGTTFEYYPAQGLADLQNYAGDSWRKYPTGYKPAHDGTRYGWVRTPGPKSVSTPELAHLYYSTGTTAEYLYGKTHPDRQYMFALSEPSAYPTTP